MKKRSWQSRYLKATEGNRLLINNDMAVPVHIGEEIFRLNEKIRAE